VSSAPSVELLRVLAAQQGIHPADADLEAVRGFLAVLLPAFAELERKVPPETVPAGLPFPVPEER
jgi:hypothetical protein